MSLERMPPVVYLGPSAGADEIKAILPHAVIMPPIQRGDLYRDRMLGFSFFLILDGVFFHTLAVPPREVLDVIEDGGQVVGASSMGAIRAAECWPAGMRGVGAIYRLFRRGALRSDDEVAVAFAPEMPRAVSTVPLVNIRYALSRVRRSGELTPEQATSVLDVARSTFYSERGWRDILSRAGLDDSEGRLMASLSSYDLKRKDALRAARRSAEWLAVNPALQEVPRRSTAPFRPNELSRESAHDAFGRHGEHGIRGGLWQWLLASGRIRRYPALRPWYDALHNVEQGGSAVQFPDEAWQSLREFGELDAAAFRFRAISEAADEARARGISPGSRHRYQAEVEIALEHGFPTWRSLHGQTAGFQPNWALIEEYRETLSLAKCIREQLFEGA